MDNATTLNIGKSTRNVTTIRIAEDEISLQRANLKGRFGRVYEIGITDAGQFHWYNLYSVCFSVAATLLITLLTTDIKDFSDVYAKFTSKNLSIVAWVLLVLLIVAGFVGICYKTTYRNDSVFKRRDAAVDEAMKDLGY